MGHLTVFYMASGIHDFKPVHIFNGAAALVHRILNGIFHIHWRTAGNLYFFVDVVTHGSLLGFTNKYLILSSLGQADCLRQNLTWIIQLSLDNNQIFD